MPAKPIQGRPEISLAVPPDTFLPLPDKSPKGRLVVVSNRGPSPGKQSPKGGLAVALEETLRTTGGMWFGWSGRAAEDQGVECTAQRGYELASINLTRAQVAGYYECFANGALWPLFHGRTDISSFENEDYRVYREVNSLFAERLSSCLRPDDTVWIHDYHLIPLGGFLRRLVPTVRIGFFLHVPFPQGDLLSTLPCAGELLRDLTQYDLVGVQTQNDLRNLKAAFQRIGAARVDDGELLHEGRRFSVGSFPIGIDGRHFAALASSGPARRLIARLQGAFDASTLIVGAERLDYSKGLVHRFRAFEMLLKAEPELRGSVTLVQIAAPSRENVPDYLAIRRELETLSGRINALHAHLDWVPLRYFNQAFSQTRLAALFRLSRVGLVTPLRDGMNLVAKEYVAAQDADDPGVLVLSRFAGAAEQMTEALIVNPHDREAMAAAMKAALVMPLEERQRRWRALARGVWEDDVHAWSHNFLERLTAPAAARTEPVLPAVTGAGVAAEARTPAAGRPVAAIAKGMSRSNHHARTR